MAVVTVVQEPLDVREDARVEGRTGEAEHAVGHASPTGRRPAPLRAPGRGGRGSRALTRRGGRGGASSADAVAHDAEARVRAVLVGPDVDRAEAGVARTIAARRVPARAGVD